MLQETNVAILEPKIQISQNVEHEVVKEQVPINSDFIGVSGSFLCLIHCLAPQMIALGSIGLGISSFFASEGWTLFFFLTCLLAVWHSSRKSVFLYVQVLLWSAFALFTTGLLVEHLMHSESIISYFGSAALITAHLVNFRKQAGWKKFLRTIPVK
jgi:hypothetical protein